MASYEKKEQLYEGKAKKVFATNDPDVVIVDYKDDATAFNGEKKGTIAGKGVINNKMTNYMFKLLEKEGVPTHLIEEISDRETIVKKVEIVPLEVIVRNVAAGSFSKKLGIEEGTPLKQPTLEFSYKCDDVYHPDDEGGIRWDDPTIGVAWPLVEGAPLVLSAKDQAHGDFSTLPEGLYDGLL